MKLQFLGGAGTVTGSKTLLTSGKHRVLIDCGLFQGVKELRLRNWRRFPVDPREIDSVILTHAHLDHSGYLPLLVKQGFKGRIYCSSPTRDLAEILLLDSARIQEEDATFANLRGFSKHSPALALYDEKDVRECLKRFEKVKADDWSQLPGRIGFRLSGSGHILGSTFVEVDCEGKRLVFSGDLGRADPMLYPPPVRIERADAIIIESTYGDRTHHGGDPRSELKKAVLETIGRGGQVLIPSFAVGRVQDVLWLLSRLKKKGELPGVPVYLDSPLGLHATEIFESHPQWHRLTRDEVRELWGVVSVIQTQEQSIRVMRDAAPAIVIAGSGMLSGGRILHHLAARLPEPRNLVLLTGFQAAGTRGRLLTGGVTELKIHGKYVPIRAQVRELTGLSAHADQTETLRWLEGFSRPPKHVFLNHGEPQALDALRVKLKDTLGWASVIPVQGEEIELG